MTLINKKSLVGLVGMSVVAVGSLAPHAAHAVVLTCEMGQNQYYPDNNPAFKTVLLDTSDHTVVDGNGNENATVTSSDTKYEFTYVKTGLSYKYIVLRTTGDMILIHHFASGNGANYKCELFHSAPKF